MSRKLINLNADLTRLQNKGYDIEVVANFLVMNNVPYVGLDKTVKLGRLVSALELSGDITNRPNDHQVRFCGEQPCNHNGEPLSNLISSEAPESLSDSLSTNYSFSSLPRGRKYNDYYEKMTTYEAALSGYAQYLDPSVTAKTFPVIADDEDSSPFNYLDTSTTRAGISVIAEKLSSTSVSIVGLGGTGAYVLDLVAKSPVKEIRLIDGDLFDQHNAFRAPGAPSLDDLRNREHKVNYFQRIYSRMHRNISASTVYLTDDNLDQIGTTDFAFICIDDGGVKPSIIKKLEESGTPFIDVGMGLYSNERGLGGTLRTTTSTPDMRSHVREQQRIPFNKPNPDNIYGQNIQIADLNMLNAALAVVKWKKLSGFYLDLQHEHNSAYSIDCNQIINEDTNVKTH